MPHHQHCDHRTNINENVDQRNDSLLEHSSDILIVTQRDDSNNVTHSYVSPSITRIFGYPIGYWEHSTFAQLLHDGVFHPDEWKLNSALHNRMQKWFNGSLETPLVSMFRIKHHSTKMWHCVECHVDTIPNTNGKQLVMVIRDIADAKKRNEMEMELFRLGALINHASDVVIASELDDTTNTPRHIYVSPSMNRMLGYDADWYRTQSVEDLISKGVIHADDMKPGTTCFNLLSQWSSNENPLKSVMFEIRYRHGKTGEWRHIEMNSTLDPNNWRRSILVGRDVTDRVKRQILEIEKAKLETARQKDEEHMKVVSHEIKNRLLASEALARNVKQTIQEHAPFLLVAPHNTAESLHNLEGQLTRGVRICINQSVARQLVHGVYTVDPEPAHVKTLVNGLCPIGTHKRFDAALGYAMLDEQLFCHIIDNLFANAVHHGSRSMLGGNTPPIYIDVSLINDNKLLDIKIINPAGPNHDEVLKKIANDPTFEARLFSTKLSEDLSDVARSINTGNNILSSGNGMSIAKLCADAMNATLTIHFRVRTVEARFTMPYTPVVPASQIVFPPDFTIVTLDDDQYIREQDAVHFRSFGLADNNIHILGKNSSEINNFETTVLNIQPPPDVLIIDQYLDDPITLLPLRLGTDVVNKLRQSGYQGKLAIRSANDSSTDRAAFIQAGADEMLFKGVSADVMRLRIARMTGVAICMHDKKTHDSPSVNSENVEAVRGPRCLGVDDDAFVFDFFHRTFNDLNASCSHVIGETRAQQEATVEIILGRRNLALESIKSPPYDIVILDLHLTNNQDDVELLGTNIASKVREANFKGILCLMTASTSSTDSKVPDFENDKNFDLILTKGVSVVDRIKTLIAARRAAAVQSPIVDHVCLIDSKFLNDLSTDMRTEKLPQLFDNSKFSFQIQIHLIDELLLKNKESQGTTPKSPRRIAHRLKGTAATLHFVELHLALKKLEEAIISTAKHDDTKVALRRTMVTIERTHQALRDEGFLN